LKSNQQFVLGIKLTGGGQAILPTPYIFWLFEPHHAYRRYSNKKNVYNIILIPTQTRHNKVE